MTVILDSSRKYSSVFNLSSDISPQILLRAHYYERDCLEKGMAPKEALIAVSQKFEHHLLPEINNRLEARPAAPSFMTVSPKPAPIRVTFIPEETEEIKIEGSHKCCHKRSPSSVADFL
jgi:hypothetical protein